MLAHARAGAAYFGPVPGAVRVAVIGYGLGGSVFHAPLIAATPGMELGAIVTSDPQRRTAASSRYPGARLVESVGDLLSDPTGWDLVVVTTPNATHYPVARAVLSSGIAVVVDKPVTPTSAEAEQLEALARRQGVSVIPYHNRRWDGDYLTVKELVSSGQLGQIWRFESRFERWKPGPPAPGWKHDPSQAGGGILYDLGSHLVDQALQLFGPPQSVYSEAAHHTSPLDDDTFVALGYGEGPAVHLWVSSTAASLGPRFRVLGSRGSYLKFGLDPQEDALRSGGTPGSPAWGSEPPERWGVMGTVEATEPVPTRSGAYHQFYAGVARHLTEGAPPPVTMAEALAGLRVLEAAVESARSRRVVGLGGSGGPLSPSAAAP